MKVTYVSTISVDCTSDPHQVDYTANTFRCMMEDIVRVCESDMVMAVRSVRGSIGGIEYQADRYSDYLNLSDNKEPAGGEFAKKHKVGGLFFYGDGPKGRGHLPPGLSGVRRFVEKAIQHPDRFEELSVGVVWAFAGDSSCSDYIEVCSGGVTVNYGSQDSWIDLPGYLPWCQKMADFLSKPFPYGVGGDEDDEEGHMHPAVRDK